jgi:regulator of sigma E protease
LTTLLAFAFVLGVLVFVHELGHFVAAKRVGIRVLKFQLGFNPTVVSFRRGDTEYGIGALPLGGYVKMAGENPEDVARDEHGEIVKRSDEFLSKSKWERFQVLIMGPVMNILLAFILTAVVLYQGVEKAAYEDDPPVVGVITAGSPASKADIKVGDKIIAVAGHTVSTWEDFLIQIGARPNREVDIKLLRSGFEVSTKVTPAVMGQSRFEFGDIGVLPDVHPFVPRVNQGEPAEKAGIKPGDVILAVDNQRITFRPELITAIASKPNQTIHVHVLRNGQPLDIPVTPSLGGCAGVTGKIGCIGVQIGEATKSIKPGIGEALVMSVNKNIEYSRMIFQTLWGLVTRETSPKQLMGPVAIAQLSGEAAQISWLSLFTLMASISLNLGLLNLMPIPVLDGGHIFIMMLEGIARRDFSVRVKEKMLLAGFVVILMLMVTVIYNDLTRISWIERLMPWR